MDASLTVQATPNGYNYSHRTSVQGHIIYSVVSLLGLCMVSGMLSMSTIPFPMSARPSRLELILVVTRLKTLEIGNFKQLNSIRILVLAIYICTLGFLFSAGLLINAWDFTTEGRCRAAIDLCLVFYVGGKVFLYLFLVERAHQLYATKLPRNRDIIYLLGIAIVIFGFGVLAVFAFIKPVTSLSHVDGKCRIGLPLIITIPLLSYDILINFALTWVFVMRGASLVKITGFRHAARCIALALPFRRVPGLGDPVTACEFFMGRSGLGALAIILPTIANLVILFILNGHENGWLCFTICTIDSMLSSHPFLLYSRDVMLYDTSASEKNSQSLTGTKITVTWSASIIHWLTSTKDDLGAGPTRVATASISPGEGEYREMY